MTISRQEGPDFSTPGGPWVLPPFCGKAAAKAAQEPLPKSGSGDRNVLQIRSSRCDFAQLL